MNISHRLRVGVALGALCTVALSAQGIAAQASTEPNGQTPCAGAPISGPGSTAQANAIPGFNSVLQAGGETDVLGNVEPGCASESATDTLGGSGAGINAWVAHSAPIAFTDDPPSALSIAQATAGAGTNASPVHTVPVAILPVSVIYNLPCYTGPLSLTSVDLAKMYDGVITTWDNALLNVDNPGISSSCAGHHINLTARADVSGTTYVFKSYLAKRNPEYQAFRQDLLNTAWPGDADSDPASIATFVDRTFGVGSVVDVAVDTVLGLIPGLNGTLGGEGVGNPIACRGNGTTNEIACVTNTADSVGYAASSNARAAGKTEASVDNSAHTFSKWTAGACSTAALTAPIPPSTLGSWQGADFTDAPVGYPICGYTYDLTYQLLKTATGVSQQTWQGVVDFLTAATSTKGQATLPVDQYDELPLPTQTVAQEAPEVMLYD